MKIKLFARRFLMSFLLLSAATAVLLLSDLNNRSGAEDENAAGDDGKIYKIGIVYFGPEEAVDNLLTGIFIGLKDQGFEKGRNLEIVMKHANGEISNFPALLQSMDNSDVDLIIPLSTPAVTAACNSVKRKPVVFTYCYDPIAAGAGSSYEDHLPHITGVGSFPPIDNTVEFIRELIPGIKSVGTLYNSSEANSRKAIAIGKEAFAKAGIELKEMTITNTNEVMQGAQAICAKDIKALWVTGDNTALQAFDAISATAKKAGLPLIINDPEYTMRGAVAALGVSWRETGEHAAGMIAKVLKGANTADIPMENFVKESIVLNNEQARELGIRFPLSIAAMVQQQEKSEPVKFDRKLKFYLVEYADSPNSDECQQGIIDGLASHGLQRGQDYEITIRNAQHDIATLSNIVDAAIASSSDLIFALSTPSLQNVAKKVKDVPVVFTNVADPVAAGAGKSFQEHQANITGISTMSDFKGMVAFLKKINPGVKSIGTLFVPAEINSVIYKDKLVEAARAQGIECKTVAVSTSNEVTNAAEALCSEGIEYVCQISDNLCNSSFAGISQSAARANKPVFAFGSSPVEKGMAAAAVARDYYDCGVGAAGYAVKVLSGHDPATIPFTYPDKASIFINKELTDKFKISVPADIMQQAKITNTTNSEKSK